MSDPISLLQRLAALHGAGRPMPADLVRDVQAWLGPAAGPILTGQRADAALGLRDRPGARRPTTAHRLAQRNAALTELYRLTAGSQIERGDRVLDWIARHRDGYPVEAHLIPHLDAVLAAAQRIPADASSVARIATAGATRAPVVREAVDFATVDPEA